jgi:hypothetical protein
MPESDLERTIDAALRDRDWLDLTLTDVHESENELRNVLDRAFGAAERSHSALTEIQVRKSRFAAKALLSCKVPVTESGGAGIFRLIFRRRGEQVAASAQMRNGLYLSIPLNSDRRPR